MKKNMCNIWLCGSLFIVFAITVFSCTTCNVKTYRKNRSHADVKDESIVAGERLAVKFCQSCHMLPSPDLLNTESWAKGVLPQMGPRLGIFEHAYERYPNNIQDPNIGRGFYPSQALLTDHEWQNIIDYYTALSPDTLPRQQRNHAIQKSLSLFKVEIPKQKYDTPATCMIRIDTAKHRIYTADILRRSVHSYNNLLQPIDSMNNIGTIVDMIFQQNEIMICNAGVFTPVNGKFGSVRHMLADKDGKLFADKTPVFQQLLRPVSIAASDLNGDGRPDYVVCEFGYLKGMFSWEENMGNDRYKHHILCEVAGSVKAVINDYNHDGLPDIWALFAQGDERIMLYVNKGKGKFDEKRILSFPPSYGSSYFELADMNKDGYPDIIYTCGDNADYSAVLKPYHGVYIFMNDGKNNFAQKYFFAINGCYKAMARDFDGDGNIDIAAISFFADYNEQPEESFVYLENKGNLDFRPYTVSEGKSGRWMSMDAADIDGDGKIDLILGNCSVGPMMMRAAADWKKGPPFIVLKNISK